MASGFTISLFWRRHLWCLVKEVRWSEEFFRQRAQSILLSILSFNFPRNLASNNTKSPSKTFSYLQKDQKSIKIPTNIPKMFSRFWLATETGTIFQTRKKKFFNYRLLLETLIPKDFVGLIQTKQIYNKFVLIVRCFRQHSISLLLYRAEHNSHITYIISMQFN